MGPRQGCLGYGGRMPRLPGVQLVLPGSLGDNQERQPYHTPHLCMLPAFVQAAALHSSIRPPLRLPEFCGSSWIDRIRFVIPGTIALAGNYFSMDK